MTIEEPKKIDTPIRIPVGAEFIMNNKDGIIGDIKYRYVEIDTEEKMNILGEFILNIAIERYKKEQSVNGEVVMVRKVKWDGTEEVV